MTTKEFFSNLQLEQVDTDIWLVSLVTPKKAKILKAVYDNDYYAIQRIKIDIHLGEIKIKEAKRMKKFLTKKQSYENH